VNKNQKSIINRLKKLLNYLLFFASPQKSLIKGKKEYRINKIASIYFSS
jgi:hypothetical protein